MLALSERDRRLADGQTEVPGPVHELDLEAVAVRSDRGGDDLLERLPSGWGVLLDDVMCGVYGAALLWGLDRVIVLS